MHAQTEEIEKHMANFAFWDKLSETEKSLATEAATIKTFAKNQIVTSGEVSCLGIAFILQGSLRVSLFSDDGREIRLYRLSQGNVCVASASCVINQITFETTISAAAETMLLVLPSSICAKLAGENIHVKEFIFRTETERYSQAMWVVQQMIFKRFDQRLAEYLISEYEDRQSEDLEITQEEIARNINSVREVVARMLKHFADEGLVEIKRGRIILKDISVLKKFL